MASAELPNDNDKIKLFGPVKTYQLHRHSKTCKNIHEWSLQHSPWEIMVNHYQTSYQKTNSLQLSKTLYWEKKLKYYRDEEIKPDMIRLNLKTIRWHFNWFRHTKKGLWVFIINFRWLRFSISLKSITNVQVRVTKRCGL